MASTGPLSPIWCWSPISSTDTHRQNPDRTGTARPRLYGMSPKQRLPLLRWSFIRMGIGARHFARTGQWGDGREAAAADYVVANARAGDIDDVIATIDKFAYEKSFLINVGDEKGALLDAAVVRANP